MKPLHRPFLALGLRLLAMVLLSGMLALIKLAGQRHVALVQIMFWRQFIPALLLLVWLVSRRQVYRLRTERFWIHARRSLIGTGGLFMTVGAVQLLPLAQATILGFTMPIFSVLLATLVLHERVGPWRWGSVLLGLLGIIIIAGPGRGQMPLLGLGVGLGAALSLALVSIQLRDLGQTEEPIRIVLYFSALGALMLSPALVLTAPPASAADWLVIGGIGITGLFAQLLMTAALRFGTVSSVIVMDYSQLVWATVWGWLLFRQLPPATTWVGAPFIIGSGLIIAWRERVRHRRALLDGLLTPNAD